MKYGVGSSPSVGNQPYKRYKLLFNTLGSSCLIVLGWLPCGSLQANEKPKPSPKLPQITRPNLNSVKQIHLPPLPPKQLSSLNDSIRLISQSWIDLAGLGKMNNPPAFPTALQKFRQSWSAKHPNVAPFLGQYQDDGQRGQVYSLTSPIKYVSSSFHQNLMRDCPT